MVQGRITEADTPTIRLSAAPSGLISDPPPSSPIFTPSVFPGTTLPLYPGLGQAPNMLDCIPSGVVMTHPAVIMVALWNRADHYIYIFILSFVLSFFFFPSPNISHRTLDVCHTSTHGVALVRI